MFKAFANDTDVLNIQGDALTVTNDPVRIVTALWNSPGTGLD